MSEILAALMGLAGGAVGGLLGVGGGILFVPALAVFLGEPQLQAEATSLLAIIPVAAVGAWRQHSYGNVHARDAMTIGLLSIPGVGIGVVVANEVPERALELSFAALLLFFSFRLFRRGIGAGDPIDPSTPGDPTPGTPGNPNPPDPFDPSSK